MKSFALAILLFSFNSFATELSCEARYEYVEDGRLVVEKNKMETSEQLNKMLYVYDGDSAYYSINLDKKTNRYLISINFAPDYMRGSLSSGKLEEGGNNLTLSVVDGTDVHKIFCLRK